MFRTFTSDKVASAPRIEGELGGGWVTYVVLTKRLVIPLRALQTLHHARAGERVFVDVPASREGALFAPPTRRRSRAPSRSLVKSLTGDLAMINDSAFFDSTFRPSR